MTINDILMLTRAGYTKEEIMQLTAAPAPGADVNPEEVLPDVIETGEDPENAAAKITPDVIRPDVTREEIDRMNTKLDYLVSRMNYINVRDSQIETPEKKSVDDILMGLFEAPKAKE